MKNRIAALLLMSVALPALADLPPITPVALNETGGYIPAMTAGPDGAVWFVDGDNNLIGRVALSAGATPTKYPVPTPNAGLSAITAGPDGNLWFLESSKIGKITISGAITEYPLGTISFPSVIAAGPDGNLWVVGFVGIKTGVAKFSTSGASAGTVNLPGSNPSNVKLATGPGNAMWFHDRGDNTVGYVSSGGAVQSFPFATPDTAGGFKAAGGLAAGSDGNMWVGHSASIARVTPSGTINEYPVPGATFVAGVAAGADGNIWFLDNGGKIGRVIVATATSTTATIDEGSLPLGSPSDIMPITRPSSSSRLIPAASTQCPAGSFGVRDGRTPPPHLYVMDLPATACADIEVHDISGGFSPRQLFVNFGVDIVNNGPNDATVTVNAQVNGVVPIRAHWEPGFAKCDVFTHTVVCTQPVAAKHTATLDIDLRLNGATTDPVTINATASSNLPDNVPTNNARVLFLDLSSVAGIAVPPGFDDVAPPPAQRGSH